MSIDTPYGLSHYWAKNFSDYNVFKEELYVPYDLQESFSPVRGEFCEPLY